MRTHRRPLPNTGWGLNSAQKNLAFKAVYVAAVPIAGVEAQYALTLDKALTSKVSANWGHASIDRGYGILNADRFQIGKRAFAMATYNISPQFLASAFITRAVGNDAALPQRTLSNIVLTYNALPDLRRTGLF